MMLLFPQHVKFIQLKSRVSGHRSAHRGDVIVILGNITEIDLI